MIKKMLSKIFGVAVKQNNKKYDSKSKDIVRLHTPVISVGNLSVGGSGKTPFVQMLTWILLKNNIKPAIVGRGYKRKSKGSIIVSDGEKILTDAVTGGDEMYLLADSLKVPVVAHDIKAEGARLAEKKFGPDVIIIDDGYQHRKLYRDLDILLVNKSDFDEPHLMPEGRLREPLEAASRADVIVYTGKTYPPADFEKMIRPEAVEIRIARTKGRPFDMTENRYLPGKKIGIMQKKGVFAVSGIAKPENFEASIRALKYTLKGARHYDDHHHYSESDVKEIIRLAKDSGVNYIVTTEKDAAKLHVFAEEFKTERITVVVLPVRLKIIDGFKTFKKLLNTLFPNEDDS